MVLPGIQALFGFQLIAVFNAEFRNLELALQRAHLAAILLVTAAIVLIMTPAAYHRIAERGELSSRFLRLGSRLIACAMVPFALGVSLDLMIIAHMITSETMVAALTFGSALAASMLAWLAFPLAARRARQRGKPKRSLTAKSYGRIRILPM
jgi:putative exporter of polyketide antibiotics